MYQSRGPVYIINGKALEVFPFWPNTKREFIEKWEWKTSVLTAYNGNEQRAGLRRHPRRSFEYQVYAQHNHKAALSNFLQAGAYTLYGVPDWNRGTALTHTTLQGVHHYFDIPVTGYTVGGYAVGFIDPTLYELRKITAVDEFGVQLDGAVTWSIGTRVYPVIPALLNKDQTLSHTTGLLAEPTLLFNGLPVTSPFEATATTYPTYLGFYVLEEVFDWSQPALFEYHYKTDTVDNMLGTPHVVVESRIPAVAQPKRWFLNTPEKRDRFLTFIHYCKGRLNPFWVISDVLDVDLVSKSGNVLTITDSAYNRLVLDKNSRQHIRAVANGIVYYRKIVSSEAAGDTELLTLNAHIPGTISEFSFMSLARLDVDRIEIAYPAPALAQVTTAIRTLNHEL